jgi:HPt (histidine-containing phosphotransfer) domain-containing protein
MVSGGDKSAMLEFYHLLEGSTVPLFQEAIAAGHAGDWAVAAGHLHKLKGQLGILSMHTTIEQVVALEHAAKTDASSKEGMVLRMEQLCSQLPSVLASVKQQIDKV